jgi:hypothetical protein
VFVDSGVKHHQANKQYIYKFLQDLQKVSIIGKKMEL